jgi:hypothetical protein
MTFITLLTETALVLVVILVTGVTFRGNRQITLLRVAITALNALVFAMQRKVGLVVVKLEIIPGAFPVTTVTHFAKLPLVRFIVLVAVNAFVFCFMIFFVRLMTALAGHGNVTATQAKICSVMIKGLFVQQDYRSLPAQMFTVADLAFLAVDIRDTPMKSRFVLDIVGHIFMVMAIKTQNALLALLKKFVAVGAIGLKFGMRLREFTRHQGQFHGIDQVSECSFYA